MHDQNKTALLALDIDMFNFSEHNIIVFVPRFETKKATINFNSATPQIGRKKEKQHDKNGVPNSEFAIAQQIKKDDENTHQSKLGHRQQSQSRRPDGFHTLILPTNNQL